MRLILHLFRIHTMEPYWAMRVYNPDVKICRYCNKIDWGEGV